MLRRLRPHLSYANVMATIAVFIALGGSSYAALTITGQNVKNSSLTWRDLKRNTLGPSRIKESRLGRVRRAANADRLNGLVAAQLLVRCPPGTFPTGGTCIEFVPRAPAAYGIAVLACQSAGRDRTPGRRLPTLGELQAAFSRVDPAPGGELTGHVYPSTVNPGEASVLYVVSKSARQVGLVEDRGDPANTKAFRCAADPLN